MHAPALAHWLSAPGFDNVRACVPVHVRVWLCALMSSWVWVDSCRQPSFKAPNPAPPDLPHFYSGVQSLDFVDSGVVDLGTQVIGNQVLNTPTCGAQPGKSMFTTVREFVENSLDAAEEGNHLPDIQLRMYVARRGCRVHQSQSCDHCGKRRRAELRRCTIAILLVPCH